MSSRGAKKLHKTRVEAERGLLHQKHYGGQALENGLASAKTVLFRNVSKAGRVPDAGWWSMGVKVKGLKREGLRALRSRVNSVQAKFVARRRRVQSQITHLWYFFRTAETPGSRSSLSRWR